MNKNERTKRIQAEVKAKMIESSERKFDMITLDIQNFKVFNLLELLGFT